MEGKIKIGLVGLIGIIIIGGIFFVNELTQIKEIIMDEKYCEKDSDCILVAGRLDTSPCCWNCAYEAINKIANDKRKLWGEGTCKNISIYNCPKCKAALPYWFMAFCDNNNCKLKSAFEECDKIEDKESRDKCYKEFEAEAKKRLE